jgi:hypothetical protein
VSSLSLSLLSLFSSSTTTSFFFSLPFVSPVFHSLSVPVLFLLFLFGSRTELLDTGLFRLGCCLFVLIFCHTASNQQRVCLAQHINISVNSTWSGTSHTLNTEVHLPARCIFRLHSCVSCWQLPQRPALWEASSVGRELRGIILRDGMAPSPAAAAAAAAASSSIRHRQRQQQSSPLSRANS